MTRTSPIVTVAALSLFAWGCEPSPSGLDTPESPASAAAASQDMSAANAQLAAIQDLLSRFHGALHASDAAAVRSLWAPDAVVTAFGSTFRGVDEITAFFEGSGPFVNGWAALAPTYRTRIERRGNTASFALECVYVDDPAGGNLAGQTVVAHLNATGTVVKIGDRWLFREFVGGVGPLP